MLPRGRCQRRLGGRTQNQSRSWKTGMHFVCLDRDDSMLAVKVKERLYFIMFLLMLCCCSTNCCCTFPLRSCYRIFCFGALHSFLL